MLFLAIRGTVSHLSETRRGKLSLPCHPRVDLCRQAFLGGGTHAVAVSDPTQMREAATCFIPRVGIDDRLRVGEVQRGEKMLFSGADPESYITE